MITREPIHPKPERDTITKAYRMEESECVAVLLSKLEMTPTQESQIAETASELITRTRKHKQSRITALLHQYDLSTDEGIALMCLAEALLRIPDKTTMDKFITDKLSTVHWKNHLKWQHGLFMNAATWSLLLTGSIYAPSQDQTQTLGSALKRTTSRLGITMLRPIILQMMKTIGKQFVLGETIEEAVQVAKKAEKKGYQYSYDMLGEAARTYADADHYYIAYKNATEVIGQEAHSPDPAFNPGISIKLSALHPRYESAQHALVLQTLPERLLTLLQLAKEYRIGVTIDAEEADRLDLSLDIFEKMCTEPSLSHWNGLGLAVQAYQKRAFWVLDWLAQLAKTSRRKLMVRLVKGAYWDSEIKVSQIQGLIDYPVFTRKHATDVSYIACAKKMLSYRDVFYSQFGTHNAYCVAAILEMAGSYNDFEFQCLHGMGEPLYDQIIDPKLYNHACRIYAPVGTHKDLLGYLVRRLLENGANTSFINQLANANTSIEKLIANPIARMKALEIKRHPKIQLPRDIYRYWLNAKGLDLSDHSTLRALKSIMDETAQTEWQAAPIINGQSLFVKDAHVRHSPANVNKIIGKVSTAGEADIEQAVDIAVAAQSAWEEIGVHARADILEKAATLFEDAMPELMTILSCEGGKCIPDCLSEVRETVDYCRYYAYRARLDMAPVDLPGPTGEYNQLTLHPRGTFVCISPWNFPLAIFSGQIIAALATGNCVIAKPAEQTSLIAYRAVEILHQAGVPGNVLQLLIGKGSVIGAKVIKDPRIAGVIFTGSTETAKSIEQSLSLREGPIGILVAETGGQNAMIVDSSALIEQTVFDVAQSAFNSAGQRCSALRVLFIQEEIADSFITMLKGYMQTLRLGNPNLLETDIGPIIDDASRKKLMEHYTAMQVEARLFAEVPFPSHLPGHYFAPCAFELPNLSLLKEEVFGPILHVIRYPASGLQNVMQQIIDTGFGLTLGIQSRIGSTIEYIANRMPIGNIYVNRNMIGAVVGVQPFGGERLSGTGPKAGGPHYLPRLCVERTLSNNITAIGGNAKLVSLLEDD